MYFLFALLLGCLAASQPPPPLTRRAAPLLLPSQDEFYSVPADIEKHPPGSILRHRTPPGAIGFGGLPLRLRSSHQILYRTTDSEDRATATVLTVLIPPRAHLTKMVSYQVAEDAASIDCAPSYAFQLNNAGGVKGNSLTESELGMAKMALDRGWVVIAPDFLGPRAAFLAGALSGRAVLDGIRAAMQSQSLTGISAHPTVSLWGYSGGSLASLWAAEQQPAYAPELGRTLAGVAAGGTVPNITSVVGKVNGTPFAGLIPAGVLGLANQYDLAGPLIDAHILPQYRDDFYAARHLCLVNDILRYLGRDIVGMFGRRDLLYTNKVALRVMDENGLGHAVPRVPLYVYKGIDDEISPVEDTDRLLDGYCAGWSGATVQYDRLPLTDHMTLMKDGAAKAFLWLEAVMRGKSTDGLGRYKCRGRRV